VEYRVKIQYTDKIPSGESLLHFFEGLGWNRLNQTAEQFLKTEEQSWARVYAYDGDQLVGAARVVSDGVATGFLCGLGVHPDYRNNGIGTQMVHILLEECSQNNIYTELFCEEKLVPFYSKMGFQAFAVGMKKAPH